MLAAVLSSMSCVCPTVKALKSAERVDKHGMVQARAERVTTGAMASVHHGVDTTDSYRLRATERRCVIRLILHGATRHGAYCHVCPA